ncbi:MAG TPA: TraR/DksA C4-type zinc finger protein [Jatrophihabitans sp.]|nr:TraR/DksA C4-type zinc finger protein [Jatrophihabitans sp.]
MTERQFAGRIAEEIASTRELLTALHRDLAEIIASSAGANADDEHDPEGATIAFERAQLSALVEQAETRLAELAAAQQRLQDGSYDRCERCGGPIGEQRLLARPATRRCVRCAG